LDYTPRTKSAASNFGGGSTVSSLDAALRKPDFASMRRQFFQQRLRQ
jgi:hypothetical protein